VTSSPQIPEQATRSDEQLGGLLRRALAQAIDLGLAACVAVCALYAASWLPDSSWAAWIARPTWLSWSVGVALPAWLALAALEALPGHASPGKRLLGLGLSEAPRAPRLSFLRIALRTGLKLLPWQIGALALCLPQPWDPREPLEFGRLMVVLSSNLWIGLYLASAAMTRRRQSLHDLALGSVVLRCKPADAERD
jgi:uncharacterized RDD family membrane protein YckC